MILLFNLRDIPLFSNKSFELSMLVSFISILQAFFMCFDHPSETLVRVTVFSS
jgi:hypothetical protein